MSNSRITTKSLTTTCILAAMLGMAACTKGFSTGAETMSSSAGGNGSLGGVTTDPDDSNPGNKPPVTNPGDISAVESMDYKAAIPESSQMVDNRFAGMQYIHFDKTSKEVVLTLPMYFAAELQADLSVSFPQYSDIRVSMTTITDSEGYLLGNALEIRVPIAALIKGVDFVPGKLPNGMNVPGFPTNEAPTTNVSFKINGKQNMKLYIYLGVNNIGFFVEGDWGGDFFDQVPLSILIPIKNEAKTALRGYFGFIAKGATSKPGFYLGYKLPADVSVFLEEQLGIQ